MLLINKKVIITGVSRGIGLALVHQFLKKGAIVGGMGINQPSIDHPNFTFYKTDIRRKSEVNASFGDFLALGNTGVDVLVNNAGVGYFGYLEAYADEHVEAMFDTNVYGTIYASQAVIPSMKKQERGHIFNISSIAGLEAFPQVSIYCATKHAVRGLSESMYKELRDFGVKVTCVYPGSVKTDFFRNIDTIEPSDNMLQPEEVASIIVQAAETSDNFHQVNLEIRPLRPKGKK